MKLSSFVDGWVFCVYLKKNTKHLRYAAALARALAACMHQANAAGRLHVGMPRAGSQSGAPLNCVECTSASIHMCHTSCRKQITLGPAAADPLVLRRTVTQHEPRHLLTVYATAGGLYLLAFGLHGTHGGLAGQVVAAVPLGSQHVRRRRLWHSHLARMHIPALACTLWPTPLPLPICQASLKSKV